MAVNKNLIDKFPAKNTPAEQATITKYRDNQRPDREQWQVNAILAGHKAALERAKKNALEKIWNVVPGEEPLNRFELMDLMITMIHNKMSLPKICEQEGFPTIREVYGWYKRHPDFYVAVQEAKRARGESLGEEAIEIVDNATPLDANVAKLRHDAYIKAAARMNSEFREKTSLEIVDNTENLSIEQIEERLSMLMKGSKEIKQLYDKTFCQEAEVVEDAK